MMATQKKQIKIEARKDLYVFLGGLQQAERVGALFTFAVSRNLRAVQAVIDDMEKFIELSDQMKEYQKKIEEYNQEHALKDENGDFILKDLPGTIIRGRPAQAYIISGRGDLKSSYEKGLKKLKEEYKEEIDKQEKKNEEYDKFLSEEFIYEPDTMIDLKDVPDEASPVMNAIIYMIRSTELYQVVKSR